ncbi:SRPBCC family protein [Paraburkholderia phenazinium]|uniref:Polyketide cyclase / dehydrase and lipid transport n=1 Tax=Paraburkholderia phenazinium TaxID=60549 RepID=A0A1N6JC32_9BURK|nr:SRPBCC family protein [Paraburkholderia phenazinium]SIO41787.1 Polyketide cyclase / dehydrase and lipid transport [Paraburkholderia phenazinium]
MTEGNMTIPRALALLAIAGSALEAFPAFSQGSMQPTAQPATNDVKTMQFDLQHRSREIHWPEGFNPETADLFSHNETVIHASCERVWDNIIDATKWPQWYPNSKDVHIIGDSPVLTRDSVFHWTTFGLQLESRIHEFVPYTRIGWYGYAPGTQPSFYHTWYLTPEGSSCRVAMDEVGNGAAPAHLRETDESLMHRGHDLWLATLKWVSEEH